jgi:hypothetical protein
MPLYPAEMLDTTDVAGMDTTYFVIDSLNARDHYLLDGTQPSLSDS